MSPQPRKRPTRDITPQEAAAELQRRLGPERKLQELFGVHLKQDAFVADQSPFVLADPGRRAGKSFGVARKVCERGLRFPGESGLFVVQSRESAKNIIWPPLRQFANRIGLKLEFREHTGDVIFPNGYRLLLRGCATPSEVDKYRGPRYPNVHVDEAQLCGEGLKYLYEQVIQPLFMDFGDAAQFTCTGTPNAACAGPFYEWIRTKKGTHHHWTARDNPHLVNVEQYLADRQKEYGGKTPAYLREYEGEWIRQEGALVFALRGHTYVDDWAPLPDEEWVYTLGIDLGFVHQSAFVVLAHAPALHRLVVVESWEETEMLTPDVAVAIDQFSEKYDLSSIVADSGGYGKAIVEELNRVYGYSVTPAKKSQKAAHLRVLSDSMASGALTIVRSANQALCDQLPLLQWDAAAMAKNRYVLPNRQKDHLADALSYAFRDTMPFGDDEIEGPTPGTPKWHREREDRAIAQLEARLASAEDHDRWLPWGVG